MSASDLIEAFKIITGKEDVKSESFLQFNTGGSVCEVILRYKLFVQISRLETARQWRDAPILNNEHLRFEPVAFRLIPRFVDVRVSDMFDGLNVEHKSWTSCHTGVLRPR